MVCKLKKKDTLIYVKIHSNGLPSVINVTMLLFDVKMVSPHSQSDLLQGSLYNVRNWSVNWDLPINPIKCNYVAIGRSPPLKLSLATRSPGNSAQVANVVKKLGISMDNSFSPFMSLLRGCLKSKMDAVYDKVVMC